MEVENHKVKEWIVIGKQYLLVQKKKVTANIKAIKALKMEPWKAIKFRMKNDLLNRYCFYMTLHVTGREFNIIGIYTI